MTSACNSVKFAKRSAGGQRTIYINTLEVGTTDFDISAEKKEALIEQGIQGTETYLQWFEDQTEAPANRLEPEADAQRHPGPKPGAGSSPA